MRLDSPLNNLTPSPSAQTCRALLKNIPYLDEKRLGNMRYTIGYLLLMMAGMFATIFIGIPLFEITRSTLAIYIFPVSLSIFAATAISVSYEQKLSNKNRIARIKETVSKYLANGEDFLCLFVGQANKLPPAEWLGDISILSYFIFTTDRLLIITFKPELIGSNQINDHIAIGEFENIIVDVHTCSLPAVLASPRYSRHPIALQ